MAKCVGHIPCPNCRSMGRDTRGDNLGVFDDGKTFCFSCGFRNKSASSTNISNVFSSVERNKRKSSGSSVLRLPTDSTYAIPYTGKSWLDLFGIGTEEFPMQWSEDRHGIVFPFYNLQKELIFYQLRLFSGNKPWVSYGRKPLFPMGKGETVVLVEDILSAIKVSRVTTAVPLFGSTIDINKLNELRKTYKSIIIWLDYDKAQAKETKKIIAICKAIFEEVKQIITEKDPKAYSTDEITDRINRI